MSVEVECASSVSSLVEVSMGEVTSSTTGLTTCTSCTGVL